MKLFKLYNTLNHRYVLINIDNIITICRWENTNTYDVYAANRSVRIDRDNYHALLLACGYPETDI